MDKYFHGGPRGLKSILPPSITNASSLADYGADKVCRTDRVYMTKIYEAALIYAAFHPSGSGVVYQVEPIGEIEPDLDYLGPEGESVCSPKAKIIKRFKVPRKLIKKVREDLTSPAD